jgi:hypothetical protein
MPLNDDDVLTIDLVFYSSASSSNINPYDATNSTPWQASSGASQSDQLTAIVANSHSSDSRASFGTEMSFLMSMITLYWSRWWSSTFVQ